MPCNCRRQLHHRWHPVHTCAQRSRSRRGRRSWCTFRPRRRSTWRCTYRQRCCPGSTSRPARRNHRSSRPCRCHRYRRGTSSLRPCTFRLRSNPCRSHPARSTPRPHHHRRSSCHHRRPCTPCPHRMPGRGNKPRRPHRSRRTFQPRKSPCRRCPPRNTPRPPRRSPGPHPYPVPRPRPASRCQHRVPRPHWAPHRPRPSPSPWIRPSPVRRPSLPDRRPHRNRRPPAEVRRRTRPSESAQP